MLFEQILNGLTIGSTYALVAIGFTMVFGVLELVNFANGSIYMLGGYITLMIYLGLGGHFVLAFILSLILTGVVGFTMDRIVLSRLRAKKAPKLSGLIATMGVATILDNFILLFFGSQTKPYPNMIDFGKFYIGDTAVNSAQLIILAVSLLLMALLSLVTYKTKFGKAMRCTAQNADAAKLMGINVNFIIAATFFISSMLAAVAGTMVGMYYQSIDINAGFTVGMKTMASAVLGGVGVLPGAMLGGLLVGLFETLGASYISAGYRDAIAFIILILIILFKPSGLLGKKKVNKV
ncbi:MAG: branched-chain amino acid ABC transporter permease [Butyricicoccus pullicaecorum]|jgi:branched-chain amino acid transport system permease protein|nr:branched-chain amino acid ABC transporter permease [Butyricicoccus pullicaecorum]